MSLKSELERFGVKSIHVNGVVTTAVKLQDISSISNDGIVLRGGEMVAGDIQFKGELK